MGFDEAMCWSLAAGEIVACLASLLRKFKPTITAWLGVMKKT